MTNPRDDLMALATNHTEVLWRKAQEARMTRNNGLAEQYADEARRWEDALRLATSRPAPQQTTSRIGAWLAAALDDPKVCAEMKADIEAWMNAGEPPYLHDAVCEPVAWRYRNTAHTELGWTYSTTEMREQKGLLIEVQPLYTHPPARPAQAQDG